MQCHHLQRHQLNTACDAVCQVGHPHILPTRRHSEGQTLVDSGSWCLQFAEGVGDDPSRAGVEAFGAELQLHGKNRPRSGSLAAAMVIVAAW